MRKSPFLIVGFAALAAAQTPRPGSSPSPKTAPTSTELLPDEQIQQVLSRLTFGARPGDAEQVRAMGIENWIDWQLHPDRIDDAGTDALMSRYTAYAMNTGDVIRDYTLAQQAVRRAQQAGVNTGDT